MTRPHDTITKTRAATIDGAWNTDDVTSAISNEFWGHPRSGCDEVHGAAGLDGPEELHRDEPGRRRHSVRPGAVRPGRAARLIYPVYTLFRQLWRPRLATA